MLKRPLAPQPARNYLSQAYVRFLRGLLGLDRVWGGAGWLADGAQAAYVRFSLSCGCQRTAHPRIMFGFLRPGAILGAVGHAVDM